MDFTPVARSFFLPMAKATKSWPGQTMPLQLVQLRRLLSKAAETEIGRDFAFSDLLRNFTGDTKSALALYSEYANRIAPADYETCRPMVMRMINGERDILWPGRCLDFAQSSGTSGGRSKFIPITADSLRWNHYRGSSYCVALYLGLNPQSRIFSGKGFVLGGSFASELKPKDPKVRIGDLSATLISKIPFGASFFRTPDKHTALLEDWEEKLPALALKASRQNVTNISGVPSWFYTVISRICELAGADKISDVWPGLEVFFHGGISFAPYREIYRQITDPAKMHFMDTYNASEGFFAVQNDFDDPAMLLLLDAGIFFEFLPLDGGLPLPPWEVTPGAIYELLISAPNGLWRYRTGDTVKVESTSPIKISIAGRTKSFINAFGEELMENNADRAIAKASLETDAEIRNYTAAPLYTEPGKKGRHQWAIEWVTPPADLGKFAQALDGELRRLNSDYDAKRSHSIFLDPPEIISLPDGTFEKWLHTYGNRKLGGQRKVPRLANDRSIIEPILQS